MALFQRTMFSTYLRPSALMGMMTLDVLSPPPAVADLGLHANLIVSPEEREVATKTGGFDMTVALDDTRDVTLGDELCQQRDERLAAAGVQADMDLGEVALFAFRARDFTEAWRSAVTHLQVEHICDTPYQSRHGGPSRDAQMRLRTLAEIQRRGHWRSPASLRNYEESGRLHQILARVPAWVVKYGEQCRRCFNGAAPLCF